MYITSTQVWHVYIGSQWVQNICFDVIKYKDWKREVFLQIIVTIMIIQYNYSITVCTTGPTL